MAVRLAREEDAAQAVETLRASIIELCADDHHFDEKLLAAWLANKTVPTYLDWLSNAGRRIWVSMQETTCDGLIMASLQGEIMLNYVAPQARFRGISTALLDQAESYLCASGVRELTLWSTRTAHRFYKSRGWQDAGDPINEDGMTTFPMTKSCS